MKKITIKFLQRLNKLTISYLGKGYLKNTIKNELKNITKLLNNNKPLILDIGDNIGDYTLELLKYFEDSEIQLFEPKQKNFEILEKNLDITIK